MNITTQPTKKSSINSNKTVLNTTPKPNQQKTPYKFAGKESIIDNIKKSIPKQLIPTKRIGGIFGGIFLLVIIIAALQFPLSSLLSGNVDITVEIGYPLTFLELKATEANESPLKSLNLFLDMIIYLILAYLIDIALNVILDSSIFKNENEIKQKPIIFKDIQKPLAQKAAEKITKN